jgi:hypothetical protein
MQYAQPDDYHKQALLGQLAPHQVGPTLPSAANTGVMGGAQTPMQPPAAPKQNATASSVMDTLRKYQHTPAGMKQAFAENPDVFTGASIMGSKGDKVRYADGSIYDHILAAGEGGKGWQALWDNDPNAAPAPMAGGGGMNPGLLSAMGGLSGLLQGDATPKIQQALGGLQMPNFDALLRALQQGGQ